MQRVLPYHESAVAGPTLANLFAVFEEVFRMKAESMQWPAAQVPVLAKQYPKIREGEFDHKFDVLLYHVVQAETASLSNTEDRRPKGWTVKRVEGDSGKTGYARQRAFWTEEVVIGFDVFSKSADRADELVDWWHRSLLFFANVQFLQSRGLNDFRFVRRLEDKMTKDFGQELYVRSTLYRLRLQLSELFDEKLLDRINLVVEGSKTHHIDG